MSHHNHNGQPSRILQPGVQQVHHVAHDGVLATQLVFTTQDPTGTTIHSLGGFTKRQLAALHIAAQLIAERDDMELAQIAQGSWSLAGELLAQWEQIAAAEAAASENKAG